MLVVVASPYCAELAPGMLFPLRRHWYVAPAGLETATLIAKPIPGQ